MSGQVQYTRISKIGFLNYVVHIAHSGQNKYCLLVCYNLKYLYFQLFLIQFTEDKYEEIPCPAYLSHKFYFNLTNCKEFPKDQFYVPIL